MPGLAKVPHALKSFFPTVLASLGFHFAVLALVRPHGPVEQKKETYAKVDLHIVEKQPAPEPLPKPEKTPPSKPMATPPATTKSQAPAKATKPTFGLNPESFAKTPTDDAIALPAGNTISIPDDGTRIRPEEVQGLAADLSSDAELIASSFIRPEYTAEAESAELEGSFAIEVFVDKDGQVADAEIKKKIGFGMDARLIEAAKNSRFKPRKDQRGQPISAWTTIRIRLNLE